MRKNTIKLKYKIVALFILLVGFSTTSCKKWLELQPEDGLTDGEYWQTKEQLKAAVMGCYASLLDGSGMPLAKYLFIWGELRGDMVASANDLGGGEDVGSLNTLKRDELYMLRTEINSTNSLVNWAAVYETINFCNDVIDNAPKVLQTDKTINEDQLKAYLAEAYGIRALMYFHLLRTFGEVPLKVHVTATDKDVTQMPKSSQQKVYDQIISDLAFATANGLSTYGNLAEDRGRITKYTAYTILADAYLWMEDYDNCIAACNEVINSGKYRIFPAGTLSQTWYNSVFFNGNSIEGIFEFQFDNQKQNPFWDMFASGGREFVAKEWISQGDLFGVDPFDPNNRDIRGNEVSMNEASSYIVKYTNSRTSSTSFAHWFAYRYSDVLLMKAEALTWLEPGNVDNNTEALNIVNDLRLRRNALVNLNGSTVDIPDPTETEAVSTFIFNERAREFAFEGKRWYDILRFAKRNNYENEEILLDIASSNALPSKQQTVINKYRDHRSHYLPIYYTELQANKALVQNPFYQ